MTEFVFECAIHGRAAMICEYCRTERLAELKVKIASLEADNKRLRKGIHRSLGGNCCPARIEDLERKKRT